MGGGADRTAIWEVEQAERRYGGQSRPAGAVGGRAGRPVLWEVEQTGRRYGR